MTKKTIKKNKSKKILHSNSRKKIKNTKESIEKYKKKNILLLAEFDNYKKRIFKERADRDKYEGSQIFKNIISLIDDIDRVLNLDSYEEKSVINGIKLIKGKFDTILNDFGVSCYDALGEQFDPDYHEAIMVKKSKKKSNAIIEEFQKGYTQHDKVLRHSKVVVSE